MLLIKLGGSVISDKRVYKRFRRSVVNNIANYLPNKNMIIVHGGGSFGHILADKYEITNGFDRWKVMGFAEIGRDMMLLNLKILDILIKNSIPAVSMPPHSYLVMGKKFNFEIFENLIHYGFVPLTYGDVAFDRDRGINICSGDYLMLELAKKFRPEKVIFLSDVDGVFTKHPSSKDAKLIKVLNGNFDVETSIKVKDVTGGMGEKIKLMRKIAKYSDVYLINGFHPERIDKILKNEDFIGTVVK